MGHVTWPRPSQGRFVICMLGLAIINPHTKIKIKTIMSRKLIMSNKFQCSNTEIPKWTHLASSRLNLHHCSTTNAHGHKCLLSTHAHRQGVDILATVFAILCVCVCTVTDFSTADRASSVKFCRAVHRRPRQAITHFGEFCSPRRSPRNQNALAGPVH